MKMPNASEKISLIDETGQSIHADSRLLIPSSLDTSKEENCVAISKLLSHVCVFFSLSAVYLPSCMLLRTGKKASS